MPREQDEDEIVAKTVGCTPELVATERERWDRNHVMRAVFRHQLDTAIEQRRTSLETISADDLKKNQGEIAGLRAARGIVLKS